MEIKSLSQSQYQRSLYFPYRIVNRLETGQIILVTSSHLDVHPYNKDCKGYLNKIFGYIVYFNETNLFLDWM